jgi:hypothetical protein
MRASFRPVAVILLALLLAVAATGCGGSSSSSSGSSSGTTTKKCGTFKKIKIAAHLGIAYIAFKKWVYTPWRQGQFHTGTPHRKTRIVKAAIAALVGVHEARVALRQLRECGAGQRASQALDSIQTKLTGMRNGTSDTTSDAQLGSEVQSLNSSYAQLTSAGYK